MASTKARRGIKPAYKNRSWVFVIVGAFRVMSETTEAGSNSHRQSLRRRSRPPLIERPRAGAKNRQGEKASGHGDVLLHFDHLIGAPMNEERGQETKSTEGKGG